MNQTNLLRKSFWVSWRNLTSFLALALLACSSLWAQNTVSGTVTNDLDGTPLGGVTVTIQGTTEGAFTNEQGQYSLTVPGDNAVLVFSFLGFSPVQEQVNGRSTVNITMTEVGLEADEVVITALGLEREKRSLGYSVTEVDGEALSDAQTLSVANALQGRVAGVNIQQGGSGPSGATRVVIRGNASLTGNNQPLYVIDGVIIDNSVLGSAGAWGGRDYGDAISNINPEEIESVSVLKGPNAAALYGQRGANGVIIITTKSGKGVGNMQVSVSSGVTVGNALETIMPELQNEYGQGLNGQFTHLRTANGDVVANDGTATGTPQGFPAPTGGSPEGPPSWGPRMEGQQYYDVFGDLRTFSPQPDNVNDFLEEEINWTNSLNISGSTDRMNYSFTGGYTRFDGMLPTNELERYNANLRVGAKLTDKLSADIKLNYIYQTSENRPNLADEQQNVMYALRYIPRDVPLSSLEQFEIGPEDLTKIVGYGPNLLQIGRERHWSSGTFTGNPYWSVNRTRNEDDRNRLLGFAKLQYDFTDWLSLSAKITNDAYTDQRFEYEDQGTRVARGTGGISNRVQQIRETNADFLLSANQLKITDDLGASVSFGGNAQEFWTRIVGASGSDFSTPGLYVINNTKNVGRAYGFSNSKIHSLYGFGQFSWQEWLYLDWTVRNDWSSTLSPDNWSFIYSSLSLGAVLSDAFELPETVDLLKVRGSWAEAGNSGGPYQTTGVYSLGGNPYQGQTVASFTNGQPFFDLQNELTTSLEFGLELAMFQNRLGVDFAWYDASTENQILNAGVTSATGFTSRRINAGEIQNTGVELLLRGTPIRTPDLSWDISFNFSSNQSEIVSLTEDIDRFRTGAGDRNVDAFVDVGDQFGNIYSRRFYARDGSGNLLINPDTGLPIVQQGRELVGNAVPDWLGGLRTNLTYKGVSLGVFLDIAQGFDIYSQSNMYMSLYGTGAWTLEGREGGLVVDGLVAQQDATGTWVSTGERNTQAITAQDYWLNAVPGSTTAVTEEFVYDGSYVALREITLGYAFPQSIIANTPFKGLRINLVGRNLGYLQKNTPGFAPDAYIFNRNTNRGTVIGMESMSFPISRTFGANVTVTF